MEKLAKCKVLIGTYINDNIILGGPHVAEIETHDNKFFIKIEQCGYRKISIKALEETSVFELYGVFTKIERLLMIFDGQFLNLENLEFTDSSDTEKSMLKSVGNNLMHQRLSYFKSSDLVSYKVDKLLEVDNATDFDDSELEDEKASEVTNTYKRGDLLKMHTYNDAIRRTIGSYVLYPGNAKQADMGNKVFSLYDEILPGVGAFAIKPSNSALGEKELCRFISDMIKEKGQDNSRLNRLKYYTEMVMQEPAAFKNTQVDSSDGLAKALCVIGYIRSERPSDYYYSLEQNDLLKPGKEFLFYYYAIKGNTVYSHHHDIAKAGTFRFYKNNIDITKTYDLEPILCDIVSSNLVSKQELVNQLNSQGFLTFVDNHNADFYYVIKVKVVKDCLPRESKNISDINGINGNDSFSPHSPKVIDIRAFLASP